VQEAAPVGDATAAEARLAKAVVETTAAEVPVTVKLVTEAGGYGRNHDEGDDDTTQGTMTKVTAAEATVVEVMVTESGGEGGE
jgi:hypothetical protein